MAVTVTLNLSPQEAADDEIVSKIASRSARVSVEQISYVRILKRSIDARQKDIRVNLSVELIFEEDLIGLKSTGFCPDNVEHAREVIIVGAGPAGLFAALRLIELKIRPIILERGKEVSLRKKDIAILCRSGIVNTDSNYCFGEGGAGTFSDGKLYTRSKKRGDNSRVLDLLCYHGAGSSILYEAHPHLGTDKLPSIISNIRKSILDVGGKVFFGKRVVDLVIENGEARGVVTSEGESYRGEAVILATGHSSGDIYEMLRRQNIATGFKPFAMGVRVEHPQELIDRLRYHGNSRGGYLPPASYNIVKQVDGRGVYSFCMCPGGFIVPSSTSRNGVVVNGMSPSMRNSPFANSGIIVEVREEDLHGYSGAGSFAGLKFQKQMETLAWNMSGMSQFAPAQRLTDFVDGRFSSTLPKVSYLPGVTSSPLHEWIPVWIGNRLRTGFKLFDSAMKGFLTSDAVVVGVESRSSSPVRITRDQDSMEHVGVKLLFPCGEGSGYSGGIVSSAIDGMRSAEAIALRIPRK